MSRPPMNGLGLVSYLRRRAAKERAKAARAQDPQDQAVHDELADLFEQRALLAQSQALKIQRERLETAACRTRDAERRVAQMHELMTRRSGQTRSIRQQQLETIRQSLDLHRQYLQRLLDRPISGAQ